MEKNNQKDKRDFGPYSSDRIWILTELYYPEETSTGFYMTRIAEGLSSELDVRVICGQPTYSARGTLAPKKEFHRGVSIKRVWGTTFNKNVIILRLFNMLTLGFSMFLKALLNFQRGDRVLVVTTPPTLPFLTALASLIRGCGYTLLIHDIYPDLLIAAKKNFENTFFVRLNEFLNRWLYKYAARIIVVGRDMEILVKKKTSGLSIPITVIPNWAELDQVEPLPREENVLLQELCLEDKFVFLYAGNMGFPNDLESFLICAENLSGDERFQFVFLGAGARRKWLEKKVLEKNLNNLTLLEPRPRSQQNDFLNACDVALVSLVEGMWGVSMPSRTYNILAAGKPLLALCEPGSELARVISEEEVGWVSPPGEPLILLKQILEIYEKRAELEKMGQRARAAALDKYSLEAALEKYKKVFLPNMRPITKEKK